MQIFLMRNLASKPGYLVFPFSIVVILTYYVNAFFACFLFIPFFLLINSEKKNQLLLIYILLFLLNMIATFWLQEIFFMKGVLTWAANSLLMFIPFLVLRVLFTPYSRNIKKVFIIVFWLAMEMMKHIGVLNWPWLTLGNLLAQFPKLIQWYRFTGVLGGSLWILIINALLLNCFTAKTKALFFRKAGLVILIFFIPIFISRLLYSQVFSSTRVMNAFITQPNISTQYNELALIDSVFATYNKKDDKHCGANNVLFLTETILSERTWTNRVQDSRCITKIRRYLKTNPGLTVLAGIVLVEESKNYTIFDSLENVGLNMFDALVKVTSENSFSYRIKSKLIPVEEYKPSYFSFINYKSDNFDFKNDFKNFTIADRVNISPVICYEVLFGTEVASLCVNSEVICMIGNEHLLRNNYEKNFYTNICRIRAIENNEFLIKASNKGLCGVLNNKGEVIYKLPDNKFFIGNFKVPLKKDVSVYSRISSAVPICLFLFAGLIICFGIASTISIRFRLQRLM